MKPKVFMVRLRYPRTPTSGGPGGYNVATQIADNRSPLLQAQLVV